MGCWQNADLLPRRRGEGSRPNPEREGSHNGGFTRTLGDRQEGGLHLPEDLSLSRDERVEPGSDAEKVVGGHYSKKLVLNSFTAILPADNPQYQLLVMLDEPKALPETHGFITSGWNAVPTGGAVIARIAPLLGVEPRFDLPPSDRLILAASKTTQ